jgi:hypothetical protein
MLRRSATVGRIASHTTNGKTCCPHHTVKMFQSHLRHGHKPVSVRVRVHGSGSKFRGPAHSTRTLRAPLVAILTPIEANEPAFQSLLHHSYSPCRPGRFPARCTRTWPNCVWDVHDAAAAGLRPAVHAHSTAAQAIAVITHPWFRALQRHAAGLVWCSIGYERHEFVFAPTCVAYARGEARQLQTQLTDSIRHETGQATRHLIACTAAFQIAACALRAVVHCAQGRTPIATG